VNRSLKRPTRKRSDKGLGRGPSSSTLPLLNLRVGTPPLRLTEVFPLLGAGEQSGCSSAKPLPKASITWVREKMMIVDESGLSQQPHRCRTWAPHSAPVAGSVDGLPAHRSRLVRDYIESLHGRIELAYLPPYAAGPAADAPPSPADHCVLEAVFPVA